MPQPSHASGQVWEMRAEGLKGLQQLGGCLATILGEVVEMKSLSFRRLVYNQKTGLLVMEGQLKSTSERRHRLFVRTPSDARYRVLVEVAPDRSLEHAISSPVQPLVYYNQWKWDKVGGNWEGLFSVDLRTYANRLVLARSNDHGFWLPSIVGISGDGNMLTVVQGLSDDSGSGACEYWLCELDILNATFVKRFRLSTGLY